MSRNPKWYSITGLAAVVATTSLLLLVQPLAIAGDFPLADKVVVEKENRKMYLLKDGKQIRVFDIALGMFPIGGKSKEGDQRTPEGQYVLDTRKPDSDFFLSIHISYPNASDMRQAKANGVDPGGQIMIHGQPNSPTYSEAYYEKEDWTNGCIAVSNSDMIDIWLMTPNQVHFSIFLFDDNFVG